MKLLLFCIATLLMASGLVQDLRAEESPLPWADGRFSWRDSGPLLDAGAGREAADPHVAIKDPSVVFHEGRWHLFATVLTKGGKVGIEYFNFTDWAQANVAPREVLTFTATHCAAPQIFYFAPQRRWYLICQLEDATKKPACRPAFSTTTDIAKAKSWSAPQEMVPDAPENTRWLDFWVICDAKKAHLFYTAQDGHVWRRETKLADFPLGWSAPSDAIAGDFFEASHTYKLKGREQYLTLVEAQVPGRRYSKAYLADRLEGPWRGLADTREKPFAARENVRPAPEWTTSISHGELLRTGVDERLEVDPVHLRFVFQGVNDTGYRVDYNSIPWRLGLLEMVP